MKIISRIEFQLTDSSMEELFRDDHFYDGPLEFAGGGPDKTQKAAEAANAQLATTAGNLATERAGRQKQFEDTVLPFYGSRMSGGLPYLKAATDYSGALNARAFNPAKAALVRRLGTQTGLPSGYADQAVADFENQRAHGFDDNMLSLLGQDEATREGGAAGVSALAGAQNPGQYFSTAGQLNQSVINAPRKPGFAGILGSLIGAGSSLGSAYLSNN